MTKRKPPADWQPPKLGLPLSMLNSDRGRDHCQTTGRHDPYPGSKLCRRCGWIELGTPGS